MDRSPDSPRSRTARRVAVAGAGGALLAVGAIAPAAAHAHSDTLSRIKHIVVIYQENHSFDNVFGGWEGVDGLASAPWQRTLQVNQAGDLFACLRQNDPSLLSPEKLSVTCTDATTGSTFDSHFPNAPFVIEEFVPPEATNCPNGVPGGVPGGCTRDLVHRFYQEQYQLNGGRQNRYVTGSDALGLAMGVYDTAALPIYRYLHEPGHPRYAVADRFFQASFGGSFLNHHWLVAASTPQWPGAVNDGSANDLHSVVDASGMPVSYPLYAALSPVRDAALTASCAPGPGRGPTPAGVVCGDHAVNTIQPTYQPYAPGTAASRRLPPQTAPTIGDRLSEAGVPWAWYSGGWSNANGDVGAPGWTNGTGSTCADPGVAANATYPNCPDRLFQYHHQAFNYYASYAPGTPARAEHLRDEAEFEDLAASSTRRCRLPAVSFVKPIGHENEHPGYASESVGSDHLVDLLRLIDDSRCAQDTMVVVTYDEFGGQWDHVPPPGQGGTPGVHDEFGPGTRIPALIISAKLRGAQVVDHTTYDTTSILATIESRFGLAPLSTRDAAVRDLSPVFRAKPYRRG